MGLWKATSIHGDLLDQASKRSSMPLIGAGSGCFDETRVLVLVIDALATEPDDIAVTIVRYRP